MTDRAGGRPQRRSRLTVQGWLAVVLASMGIVVLAGAGAGAVLLQKTNDKSDILTGTIQPARISAYQLQAALVDQETAVRGYAIAAEPQFLAPFAAGRQTEGDIVAELEAGLVDHPDLLADLAAIEGAALTWRTEFAEPLTAAVTPGVPRLVDADSAADGKIAFDTVRALFDRQNTNLLVERQALVSELTTLRRWRDGVLATTIAVFFVTMLLLAVSVRSAVTRPLERLAAACRRTTEEDFDEPIEATGPKDIYGIAIDVENMRQRIVAALSSSQSAHQLVSEQARDLDAQAVELRRSNAELEQFAYVASHDLQEPLRKIASFCQLLKKRYGESLDSRGIQYIDFAVDGATRMQNLINELLTFSRVGRQSSHTPLGLDRTLDTAIGNLADASREARATIIRTPHRLPRLTGDPTLLVMLWQNLLGNAIKFRHPDRDPEIAIDIREGNGMVHISVSDNGIGIDPEFADKVFVIFQRLHTREAYTGTGIGLAMCRKIVEYHGGRIWLDTSYTAGTRLSMTLPIESAATTTSEKVTS